METLLLLGLVLTAAISIPLSIAALVVSAHTAARLRTLAQRDRGSDAGQVTDHATPRIEIRAEDREIEGRISIEERVGARGFVWLGAVALAVAGTFLVEHSVDAGWLGPEARVGSAVVLGLGLLFAGAAVAERAPRIAPALCAAGVADLFACWLAMGSIYQWIPPVPALALATLTAGAAILLAVRVGVTVGWAAAIAGAAFVASWAVSGSPHPSDVALVCLVVGAPIAGASWLYARRPERATGWSALASVTTLLFYLVAVGHRLAADADDFGGLALAGGALATATLFALARLPTHARDWPFGVAVGLAASSLGPPFGPAMQTALLAALVPAAMVLGTRLDVRATIGLIGPLALFVLASVVVLSARVFTDPADATSGLLGVGIPSVALALAARIAGADRGERSTADAFAVASALSCLAWLTVAIRVALPDTAAEQWAYSVAWLAYGGLVLVVGVLCASRPLRLLSLAVVLVSVGKVFLLDTAHLEGLWRVAALLGLGASLISLALLYQRVLFPPPRRRGWRERRSVRW